MNSEVGDSRYSTLAVKIHFSSFLGSTFLYVSVLSSGKYQNGCLRSRCHLQRGSRMRRNEHLLQSHLLRIRKPFPEDLFSPFISQNWVSCPSWNQLPAKGIGCSWVLQARVHIHWFRQMRIHQLQPVQWACAPLKHKTPRNISVITECASVLGLP